MDSDAAALLDALKTPNHTGLYNRFASFLQPFNEFITISKKPSTSAAGGAEVGACVNKRTVKGKKTKPTADPHALRPLAKRFLQFLVRALQTLPAILVKSSKSPSTVVCDDEGAVELLAIHRLLIECLACIGPCLDGKPYLVLLQRGRFVHCLEAWERYFEVEDEVISVLKGLKDVLVEVASMSKAQKRKVLDSVTLLPEPRIVCADDPDVAVLAVELIVCLTGSTFKRKSRNAGDYERILQLVQQVQPWIQLLDIKILTKCCVSLVNTLYRCSYFLTREYVSFDCDLVRRFSLITLQECLKPCSMDSFPSMVRRISSSIDLKWAGGMPIILDVLRLTLQFFKRDCKAGVFEAVNKYLEALSFIARIIFYSNIGDCKNASNILYETDDDLLQISSAIASMTNLYATGLYIKSQRSGTTHSLDVFDSPGDESNIVLMLNNGENLRKMVDSLENLARCFSTPNFMNQNLSNKEVKDSEDMQVAVLESRIFGSCGKIQGEVSWISYFDALEFLCKSLVEHVNGSWQRIVCEGKSVLNLNHVLDVLHQFLDLFLAMSRRTKTYEKGDERLHESLGVLLQVAVLAFKISLLNSNNHQKSLFVIKWASSSAWVKLQELKFLISSLNNTGASFFNTGQLKQASIALELCCSIMWIHIKLIRSMYSNKIEGLDAVSISEEQIKEAINDGFSRASIIIDVLYKCGVDSIYTYIVNSLLELCSAEELLDDRSSGCMSLVKLWVKIICKNSDDGKSVDDAPVLYFLLLDCSPTCPSNILGNILEQEVEAYKLMKSRNQNLCQMMQLKVIDILLNNVYHVKEYNLQRSRLLVRKASTFRDYGIEGLSKCVECLSEAISLLSEVSGGPSEGSGFVCHQLALAYCLRALCHQETNGDCEMILDDLQHALNIWLGMDIQSCHNTDNHKFAFGNSIPLLCCIADLLSLKSCLKVQFDICELIIRFCMLEKTPIDKILFMLWKNGRLSHSFCRSSIDEDFLLKMSEQFRVNANSLDYWISCMEHHPPSLCMFLQKFMLSDCILYEDTLNSSKRSFCSKINVEEVKKIVLSLISQDRIDGWSVFIAGHLYHDLSDRLSMSGRVFEALSFAREALRLRKKLLRRKFIYSASNRLHFEVGTSITEVWPDAKEYVDLDETLLSPWNVLRSYLESTFQVGSILEFTGNGPEAELFFEEGKRISISQRLPVIELVFTLSLGQLYQKKQLWDLVQNELNSAKTILAANEMMMYCKCCKLTFEVTIDIQAADLSRNVFQKNPQVPSTKNLLHPIGLYRSALQKLEVAEKKSFSIFHQAGNAKLCDNVLTKGAKDGVCNTISALCRTCSSLGRYMHVPISQKTKFCEYSCVIDDSESAPVNAELKKGCKNQSKRIVKNRSTNPPLEPRKTRSTNRKIKSNGTATGETVVKYDCVRNQELSLNNLVPRQSERSKENFIDKANCNEESIFREIKCWKCFLIQIMNDGSLQNIIYMKWECYHRRHILMLLLRIASCLGTSNHKHRTHEVHEVFVQCIFMLLSSNPPRDNVDLADTHLLQLLVDESLGNIFPFEHAEILYNLSWLSLKDMVLEQSRDTCCSLAMIQLPVTVSCLLRAFMLSQEVPSLLQKVSRLLSVVIVLSTVDSSSFLPFQSERSLSLNHWAAYFHQISIGTPLVCQYLARDEDGIAIAKDIGTASTKNFTEGTKYIRFASENVKDLEKHVMCFFQSLPTLPIICISMIEGDYVNLIGETLLLTSCVPAWILLTRLNHSNQPIVILLPVDPISLEMQLESSPVKVSIDAETEPKHWQCPWDSSVVDNVAPSFKQLLEENFCSLANTSFMPGDKQTICAAWWSQRIMLNNCLDKFLKSMEDSWLGPWRCLLSGEIFKCKDEAAMEVINILKSKTDFEINVSLVKTILSGAKSAPEAEACIFQLLLYKGYFARGACWGEERYRAFSGASASGSECLSKIYKLIEREIDEHAQAFIREPTIMVLDSDVQMLPWENIPILRSQEVYRMPSVGSILITLYRSSLCQDEALGSFPIIDPRNTYYLLNPSGDLNSTQIEFEHWFRSQKWEGKAGNKPTTEELLLALQNHDLFLYFGHGSGTQYISGNEIKKLNHCAATLLMGCSSGSLVQKGCYPPEGAPLSYLYAGSPAVIANLWDVSDKDIDRFGKTILKSWLQDEPGYLDHCPSCNQFVEQIASMSIDSHASVTSVSTRKRASKAKKTDQPYEGCEVCRSNRIASFMSQARKSCKLPLLIGASPVCYGVPAVIQKR